MPDETHEDRLLMRALAGEPLPGDDPEAAAIEADLGFLRDQLHGLGDTLAARAEPARNPAAAPARRRRPFRIAVGALVAACAASLAGGLVWLGVNGAGTPALSSADKAAGAKAGEDAKRTPEGFVACSALIAEGTVLRVDPVPGTRQDRITLRVTRYFKPETGARTVTFPMDRDVLPRLKPGDRPLISIPVGSREPDNWALGKDRTPLRTMVVEALPGAKNLPCDHG
ncbi:MULTISPECIES: hypothetical protein [Streptomyces]|uniref:Uncharacterized protein n=1 Tax=Streptomyces xanthii TaxID=2768069 RepID=A0A7H1BBY6_9ACTN|nr:hypothetical protein [Streptomyces xanthii]QNS06241.1 hypothetical protein IAG42_23450 [Streptomyces xanthii]